jgi:hypothetical protein
VVRATARAAEGEGGIAVISGMMLLLRLVKSSIVGLLGAKASRLVLLVLLLMIMLFAKSSRVGLAVAKESMLLLPDGKSPVVVTLAAEEVMLKVCCGIAMAEETLAATLFMLLLLFDFK